MNKVNEVALSVVAGYVFLAAACSKSGPSGTIPPTCSAPQITCGAACVNPASDAQNCGRCGNACQAGQSSQIGTCQCQPGVLTCNGACVSSDATNCGMCGNRC